MQPLEFNRLIKLAVGGIVPDMSQTSGTGAVASTQPKLSLQEAGQMVNAARPRAARNVYGQIPGAAGRPGPPRPQAQMTLDQAAKSVNSWRTDPNPQPASRMQIAPQTPLAQDKTYVNPNTAQVNFGRNAATAKTPINAQPASMQSGGGAQQMHPSERAKQLREQLNQRRRDVAFGRGSFAPGEEQRLMAEHESLIAQSNKMRNDPNYKVDPNSTNPRDVADRMRIDLNKRRSAAGGEVADAPQVMQQINTYGQQYDRQPAMRGGLLPPTSPPPGGIRRVPSQLKPSGSPTGTTLAQKFGADMTPFEFGQNVKTAMRKQAIVEGIGGLAGMATAPASQSDLAAGRGALRGVGTVAGGLSGGMLGGLGGAGLGALLGALIRREGMEGMGPSNHAGTGMTLGALAGGLGGAGYGAYKGNKATKALLDKAAPLDEEKDDGDEKKAG